MPGKALICLGLLALLGGCAQMGAEMRAPPGSLVPATLTDGSADPVPGMAAQAAAAFADAGRSLAGQPAATARATGQVEVLLVEFARNPRWAPLPDAAVGALRTARLELRATFGIRSGADGAAVGRALGAAEAALRAGDRRAAQDALAPALFEPGGAVTLARLTAPGFLPEARNGTAAARDAVRRLQQEQVGGTIGALDPNSGWVNPLPGQGAFGPAMQ
jgi:hypothetical protein